MRGLRLARRRGTCYCDGGATMTTTKTQFFDGAKSMSLESLLTMNEVGYSFGDGKQLTPQRVYGAVPFLYRCVDVRANAMASMPWTIYRGQTEIATDDIDQMPAGLEFCANLPEYLYQIEAALCLSARAYLLKLANTVRVVGLKWLDPATMDPVWTPQGIIGFRRTLSGGGVFALPPEQVVYLWLKGTSEVQPRPAPAAAALAAAGVLASIDDFSRAFFERGAIKGTLLTVDGVPAQAERDRLKAWWARAFGRGGKTAFAAEVVAAAVKPVTIGEGVSELGNSTLTAEKREDIATALGVPHSIVLSNAANYATSAQDVQNFYNQTVQPAARLIQRQMNDQLFAPMGLRLEFRTESLQVYQADENLRATTFKTYIEAGLQHSLVAQMLDIDLPQGYDYSDIDAPAQVKTAAGTDKERRAEEVRFRKWAAKRRAPDVTRFTSDVLSDADKLALLAEALSSETDAPFPLDWSGYP